MNTSPDNTTPGFNVDHDHELLRSARALHEHACEHVDAATRAKLATARREALTAKDNHPRMIWLPATGAAVACALAIGLLWLKPQPNSTDAPPAQVATMPDAELPPDGDARQFDLYQDLDFYQWLARQPQTRMRQPEGRQ